MLENRLALFYEEALRSGRNIKLLSRKSICFSHFSLDTVNGETPNRYAKYSIELFILSLSSTHTLMTLEMVIAWSHHL